MCPQVIFKADNMFRFQQEINAFVIVGVNLYCLLLPPPKRPRLKRTCDVCVLVSFPLRSSAPPTLCICNEPLNQQTSTVLPPPNHQPRSRHVTQARPIHCPYRLCEWNSWGKTGCIWRHSLGSQVPCVMMSEFCASSQFLISVINTIFPIKHIFMLTRVRILVDFYLVSRRKHFYVLFMYHLPGIWPWKGQFIFFMPHFSHLQSENSNHLIMLLWDVHVKYFEKSSIQ